MAQRHPFSGAIALSGLLLWPVLASLTGCATPPAPQVASPVAVAGTAVPWSLAWLGADDPLLSQLMGRARQHNPGLLQARAVAAQAAALRDQAAALQAPVVSGSASAQRSTAGQHSAGNQFDLGLGITWVPDWFGAQRSALAAADASWQSSQATARSTEIALGASLSLSYISLRSAQARLALAQANLASQQETLQITDWRRQAGLVTDLEAAQARSAAAQTESLLPALQTQIDQSSHALATASGDAPDQWLSALAPMASLPDNASTAPTSVAVDTLRQRPDVQATEALFRAARATLDQTEAERLPSLSLSATLGLSAIRLGSLLHNAALLSNAFLGLTVPLLDGGAGAARVAAQQAVVAQARNAWISSVLTALREVDDALVAQRNDQLALAALVQAATAAAEADRLAALRYRSGLVDFQTVLETQRSRLSTEDGVALARATLQADRIRLVQALGGGWTPDLLDLPDPVWAHLDAATD